MGTAEGCPTDTKNCKKTITVMGECDLEYIDFLILSYLIIRASKMWLAILSCCSIEGKIPFLRDRV